jgi:arsenate reductase
MSERSIEDLPLDQQHTVRTIVARLVPEHAGTFGPETIERFVLDSLAQLLPTAKVTTYLPVLAEKFTKDRLRALARIESTTAPDTPGVLFLCVHNAGRSQMAAGWMRELAGPTVTVWSGGSEPGAQINPLTVEVMAEVGIDITEEFPKPWTEEILRAADVVVTMGCGDACPIFPGKRYEDWVLDDPSELEIDGVRSVRDDIRTRVEALIAELQPSPTR